MPSVLLALLCLLLGCSSSGDAPPPAGGELDAGTSDSTTLSDAPDAVGATLSDAGYVVLLCAEQSCARSCVEQCAAGDGFAACNMACVSACYFGIADGHECPASDAGEPDGCATCQRACSQADCALLCEHSADCLTGCRASALACLDGCSGACG